jgi:hypothetical protein
MNQKEHKVSYEDYGFDSSDVAVASEPKQQNSYQQGHPQNGGYGNNQGNSGSYNGGSGGYNRNNRGGSGFKKFERPKEIVTDQAYSPVAFFIDRTFSKEVKDKLRELIFKFASKQYVIRVNGDDKEFIESLKGVAEQNIEVYLAWKNFNEIDSKHYWNTETSGLIAAKFFSAWDKVSDQVRAFLQRNIRMLFGDKNNSCAKILVTWSEDGASKTLDVSMATGKASHVIRAAAFYSIPVFNTGKAGSEDAMNKIFNLL